MGMELPVVTQRMTLNGKGRSKNRWGANLPMDPMRTASPSTALPTFLINAIVLYYGYGAVDLVSVQWPAGLGKK
jgi:hypothetical protein